MSLAGRTALVTGSTSGIGLAIASGLARAGADIVLNGLGDADETEPLRQELIAEHGVRVSYEAADLANPTAIDAMFERLGERHESLDILVNNAGVQHVAPVEAFPVEWWNAIIAINLNASFHTIRHALPGMKARRWGRIIQIASAHALVASPLKSAYVASKHAIAGLTKTVALETAEYGVTANAICPGYVWTPLVERQIPETAAARKISPEAVVRDVLLAAQPSKQFVPAKEIAALAVHLASEEASAITGAILPIDGGWTAH